MSDDLQKQILELVSKSKTKVGVNEVTKSLDRGIAKLIVIAQDVDPKEIVKHLPDMAKQKGVSIAYVSSKAELGKAAGKNVAASSVAIIDTDPKMLEELIKKLPKVE
jgi:large subunit ribosomal protein L7Ae